MNKRTKFASQFENYLNPLIFVFLVQSFEVQQTDCCTKKVE